MKNKTLKAQNEIVISKSKWTILYREGFNWQHKV